MRPLFFVLTLALCFALSLPAPAWADEPVPAAVTETAPASPAAAAASMAVAGSHDLEIAFLNERLQADVAQSRTWWYGWLTAFGVMTLAQGGVVAFTHQSLQARPQTLSTKKRELFEGLRADSLVGGAGSFLGLAGVLISPIRPDAARPATDAAGLWAQIDERAQRQHEAHGWINHVLNAAVAVGSGAALWGYYDRMPSAALNLGAGLAIGEFQIYTVPSVASETREAYDRKYPVHAHRSSGTRIGLVIYPHGAGLAFHD